MPSASRRVGDLILRASGVTPSHFWLLIGLFRTLGARQELTGQLGMDPRALRLLSHGLWVPGAFMALIALGPTTLQAFDLAVLSIGSFLLFMLVMLEASNTFLNPVEAAVLAPQPITGATYFAAKLTYLVLVVGRIVLALQVPSALAGCFKAGARWFYPFTHLLAAYLLGILIALAACAAFGLLFRWLPASRVRAAALWIQLALTGLPVVLNMLMGWMRPLMRSFRAHTTAVDWSFLPLLWFNALALAGHQQRPHLSFWPSAIGMGGMALFVGYGVRSLSTGYMSRITGVMRSGTRPGRRWGRRSWLGALVGRFAASTAGQAAFTFVTRMMRRDWQFRRAMIQALPLLFVTPGLIVAARAASPFNTAQIRLIGLVPELLPLCTLMVCSVLSYSDHYRGAWIFLTVPRPALRAYVRGAIWSIWLLFIALPLIVACPLLAWYWGGADAALFLAYALSVGSWLLTLQLFIVEGLPFASPPRSDRTAATIPMMLFGPIAVGIGFVVQAYFLFHSRWFTAAATVVFALLAKATAQAMLVRLDERIDQDLAQLGGNRAAMFEHVASS